MDIPFVESAKHGCNAKFMANKIDMPVKISSKIKFNKLK